MTGLVWKRRSQHRHIHLECKHVIHSSGDIPVTAHLFQQSSRPNGLMAILRFLASLGLSRSYFSRMRQLRAISSMGSFRKHYRSETMPSARHAAWVLREWRAGLGHPGADSQRRGSGGSEVLASWISGNVHRVFVSSLIATPAVLALETGQAGANRRAAIP